MGYPIEKQNVWVLFLNKGLIRHHIFWKPCIFSGLKQSWHSKVNVASLQKEARQLNMCFSSQKVPVHNRVSPINCFIEYLGHSWSTPQKNCLGVVIFFKGLIRHHIFGKPCIFLGLKQLWHSKVNGAPLQKKADHFFYPNKFLCTIEYLQSTALLSILDIHGVPP